MLDGPIFQNQCVLDSVVHGFEIYDCCQDTCDEEGRSCRTTCDHVRIDGQSDVAAELANTIFRASLLEASEDRCDPDPYDAADEYTTVDPELAGKVVCCLNCNAGSSCNGCMPAPNGLDPYCNSGFGQYMVCDQQDTSGASCGTTDYKCWTGCSAPAIS